ncbi:MFS transporter [Jiella mangrovi]|uniref:MFS transporter n=1 Tax=Jiella mangrovi TaxID=2821407 RepID=A0ABS4BC75_9HYPH|nr:MFS transporter [Jiella mangrovi]MBP0614326.1 MFS transporter [Jiella mangrovi]
MSSPTVDSSPVSQPAAFRLYALTLMTFFAASAAPTPLYRLYQQTFALSPFTITLIFAVYAFSLLAALLIVGSISDYIGRRSAVALALVIQSMALVMFLLADGPGMLIGARFVQGFATGAAASTLGAALVDADGKRGPLATSLSPMFGMALGALAASALAAYGPEPMRLVYALLLVAGLVQLLLLTRVPETVTPRPGVLASLRPKVVVPAKARRTLALVTPINASVWILAGFFLSLMPSLLARVIQSSSPLLGGIVVAGLMVSGALSNLFLRTRPAGLALIFGSSTLLAGVAILLVGIHLGALAWLVLGTLVAGLGFGASFLGSLGTIMPSAAPHQRAELLAAFYVESYLAFSVPALIAGYLAGRLGITATADIYAAVIALLVVGGLAAIGLLGLSPRGGTGAVAERVG